jgi:hypothetical protein
MAKYDVEVQNKCVELVKQGTPLAEVSRQLGPNAKAVQRYCVKAGVVIPKKEKAKKAE